MHLVDVKVIKHSLTVLLVLILTVAIVEIMNDLMPIPFTGAVTVKQEIGKMSYPPILYIVEATMERNEANLTLTIKVNGDLPNQTTPSAETDTTYIFDFNYLVRVELNGSGWSPPMLGHSQYRGPWKVDYAGKDFPGSLVLDQKDRTIRITLNLNSLKEKGVGTEVTSGAFAWDVGTIMVTEGTWGSGWYGVDGVSSYFPDYLSYQRPVIHAAILGFIILGGIVSSLWLVLKMRPHHLQSNSR